MYLDSKILVPSKNQFEVTHLQFVKYPSKILKVMIQAMIYLQVNMKVLMYNKTLGTTVHKMDADIPYKFQK